MPPAARRPPPAAPRAAGARFLFRLVLVGLTLAPGLGLAQQVDVPLCCLHDRWAGEFIDVYLNCEMCDDAGGRRCDLGCLAAGNEPDDCCWFLDRKHVAQSLKQALNAWNMQGQAMVRFRYDGETTLTSGSGADIVVNMQACLWQDNSCSGACFAGGTVSLCGSTMQVPIYKWSCRDADDAERRPRVVDLMLDWNTVSLSEGRGWSSLRVFMHELGHLLGMPHPWNDCAGGSPGYLGGPTNMAYGLGHRGSIKVWPEDAKALISGSPNAYGLRTSQTLRHARKSTNPPTLWSPEVDPGTPTNFTPGVAFARVSTPMPWCSTPPCSVYAVAFTSPLGFVATKRTTGFFWESDSAVPGAISTQAGPAIAARETPAFFLLVFIGADNENTIPMNASQGACAGGLTAPCVNYLWYSTSTDGNVWTAAQPIVIGATARRSAVFKPALSYSSVFDRFHLVYPSMSFNDDEDGRLWSLTFDPATLTWSEGLTSFLADAAPHARTIAGPGIVCPNLQGNICLAAWASADPRSTVVQSLPVTTATTLSWTPAHPTQPTLPTRVFSLPLGTLGSATHDFGAATAPTVPYQKAWMVWRSAGSGASGPLETASGTCGIVGQQVPIINWNCLLDWNGQISFANSSTGAGLAYSSAWTEISAHWAGP